MFTNRQLKEMIIPLFIRSMDTGKTLFLDHFDPEIVKTLSKVVENPIEVGDARPSHDEWDKQRKEMDTKK